ncbi:rsbT co-antagonist protein RsbR [Bacillus sp. OV322]|uniref:STAS domain-containing protein n=1 Tax=Bacillus sp. OV322 TaxID=1882764 RepID=UPI0008E7D460|nr:STAS domain-containing protein [Bacillus sp. OV322]SFC19906.1 rsbT co-antagonist protein RsbR [Bacillus sp. OV322]
MDANKELHEFLLEKTWGLTEEWYASLDKSDPAGVYSSTDPEVIKAVKQQNYEFHIHFCDLFIKDESSFIENFESWILEIAQDEQHLGTPIHFILREFFRTQEQYLDLLQQFFSLHKGNYSEDAISSWERKVIKIFSKVMIWFVQENHNYSMKRLESQQRMINELSSPVIPIGSSTALLPLVGDIDTARAKFILENTLEQCAEKLIKLLYIDLSGVVIMDTMVAQQIFQLIKALSLIGVKSILSGIRPEIAQTAIQLGLDFKNANIKRNLELV